MRMILGWQMRLVCGLGDNKVVKPCILALVFNRRLQAQKFAVTTSRGQAILFSNASIMFFASPFPPNFMLGFTNIWWSKCLPVYLKLDKLGNIVEKERGDNVTDIGFDLIEDCQKKKRRYLKRQGSSQCQELQVRCSESRTPDILDSWLHSYELALTAIQALTKRHRQTPAKGFRQWKKVRLQQSRVIDARYSLPEDKKAKEWTLIDAVGHQLTCATRSRLRQRIYPAHSPINIVDNSPNTKNDRCRKLVIRSRPPNIKNTSSLLSRNAIDRTPKAPLSKCLLWRSCSPTLRLNKLMDAVPGSGGEKSEDEGQSCRRDCSGIPPPKKLHSEAAIDEFRGGVAPHNPEMCHSVTRKLDIPTRESLHPHIRNEAVKHCVGECDVSYEEEELPLGSHNGNTAGHVLQFRGESNEEIRLSIPQRTLLLGIRRSILSSAAPLLCPTRQKSSGVCSIVACFVGLCRCVSLKQRKARVFGASSAKLPSRFLVICRGIQYKDENCCVEEGNARHEREDSWDESRSDENHYIGGAFTGSLCSPRRSASAMLTGGEQQDPRQKSPLVPTQNQCHEPWRMVNRVFQVDLEQEQLEPVLLEQGQGFRWKRAERCSQCTVESNQLGRSCEFERQSDYQI
eukprot:284817687_2